MRIISAIIFGTLLCLLLCFSAFGFLATFELTTPLERLPWQAAYVMLGGLSAVGMWRNARRALRRGEGFEKKPSAR